MKINELSIYLLILLLFLFSGEAKAQMFSYNHYDLKDGLAGSTVYGMAQDHDGFMWFATETGLSRFDGTSFKNYTIADGLPGNEVLGLYVDAKNRIWIACFKNAISYYSKGKIYNQQNDSVLKKINIRTQIRGIGENAAGDLLFRCGSETFLLKHTGAVQVIPEINAHLPVWKNPFHPIAGMGSLQVSLLDLPAYVRMQTGDMAYVAMTSGSPVFNKVTNQYACQSCDNHFMPGRTVFLFYDYNTSARILRLPPEANVIKPVNANTYAILKNYGGVTLFNINEDALTCNHLSSYIVQSVLEDIEGNT